MNSFNKLLAARNENNKNSLESYLPYKILQPLFYGKQINETLQILFFISRFAELYGVDEENFASSLLLFCRYDNKRIEEFNEEDMYHVAKFVKKSKRLKRKEAFPVDLFYEANGEKLINSCDTFLSAQRESQECLTDKMRGEIYSYFEKYLRADMLIPAYVTPAKTADYVTPRDIAMTLFFFVSSYLSGRISLAQAKNKTQILIASIEEIYRNSGYFSVKISFQKKSLINLESSEDSAILKLALLAAAKIFNLDSAREMAASIDLMKFFDSQTLLFAISKNHDKLLGGRYERKFSRGIILYVLSGAPYVGLEDVAENEESLISISAFLKYNFFPFESVNSLDTIYSNKMITSRIGEMLLGELGGLFNFEIECQRSITILSSRDKPSVIEEKDFLGLRLFVFKTGVIAYDSGGHFAVFCQGRVKRFEVVTESVALGGGSVKILRKQDELLFAHKNYGSTLVVKFTETDGIFMEVTTNDKASAYVFSSDKWVCENEYVGNEINAFKLLYLKENYNVFKAVQMVSGRKVFALYDKNTPHDGLNGVCEPYFIMLAHLELGGKLPEYPSVLCRKRDRELALYMFYLLGKKCVFVGSTEGENADIILEKEHVKKVNRLLETSPFPTYELARKLTSPQVKRVYSKGYELCFNEINFDITRYYFPFDKELVVCDEANIWNMKITFESAGKSFSPFYMLSQNGGKFAFRLMKNYVEYEGVFENFMLFLKLGADGNVTVGITNFLGAKLCGTLKVQREGGIFSVVEVAVKDSFSKTYDMFNKVESLNISLELSNFLPRYQRAVNTAAISFFNSALSCEFSPIVRALAFYQMSFFFPERVAELVKKRFSKDISHGEALLLVIVLAVCLNNGEPINVLNGSVRLMPVDEFILAVINKRAVSPIRKLLKLIALTELMSVKGLITNRSYVASGMLKLKQGLKINSVLSSLIATTYFKSSKYAGGVMRAINLPHEFKLLAYSMCGEEKMFRREAELVNVTPYTLNGGREGAKCVSLIMATTLGMFKMSRASGFVTFFGNGLGAKLKLKGEINAEVCSKNGGGNKNIPIIPLKTKRSVKVLINT